MESAKETLAAVKESTSAGYASAPLTEQAAFNLTASFAATIGVARAVNYLREHRQSVLSGSSGGHRVHHYLPGMALALLAGTAAAFTSDDAHRRWLALPFGSGLGLILDEAAMVVKREDVYWNYERLALAETIVALAGSAALAARFLRRGEREREEAGAESPPPASAEGSGTVEGLDPEALVAAETKAQLLGQARELGISGRSRMTKLELARAILRAKSSEPPPTYPSRGTASLRRR